MKDPVLVIMAAGMGSRYGGLKQIDPVDEQGHIIMDFSVYDAVRAGFKKVVFVIKKENEALFREVIGDRVSEKVEVAYVHQNLDALPEGYAVPADRVKPWGTGHAVLCAYDAVAGAPFAVINADDYYGKDAFKLIYDYLSTHEDDDKYRFTMVGYSVKNTVTENGHVSRGVCQTDENHYLTEIVERTHIEKREDGAAYTEDEGATWTHLDGDTVVSMNMWGFSAPFMEELKNGFPEFLDKALAENPLKGEYFLPFAVEKLLTAGKATVEVLHTPDKWYGVTYKEDKPVVMEAMQKMKEAGVYPAEF
ncbi:MAG: sugar phosphate nucleotidyltransferase [Lachnospiraceae bacterium]|nr:sugar phosphate nucleotidyltransferase [Lachnospiraceae bacterium]